MNKGQISTLALFLLGGLSTIAFGIGGWNALATINQGERIIETKTEVKNIEKRFDRFEEKIDKRFTSFEAVILKALDKR